MVESGCLFTHCRPVLANTIDKKYNCLLFSSTGKLTDLVEELGTLQLTEVVLSQDLNDTLWGLAQLDTSA